ncbi:hypothetical protein GJ631_14745 [Natronomonas sp. CBA1123]|jgi:hypothetical protein|uniref:DUF6069 family protein n=1 Tax=Natronomonas sp. CBA1123 TaxID=2668070 RepID=UPI0012EADB6C|nr:DUF6069 family protein [Natronomonas sp. CBA1123]MUV87775.1 hypothetical protein [Natronomonas sp. CBA1123]
MNDLLRRGAVAVVAAIVANLLVLGVALVTLGAGGFDPFAVPPVALVTAIGAIGGTAVYVVFKRVFGPAADRRFVVVAVGVTLVSMVTLVQASSFEGATTARLAVLALMHVVAAAVTVAALVDRSALR